MQTTNQAMKSHVTPRVLHAVCVSKEVRLTVLTSFEGSSSINTMLHRQGQRRDKDDDKDEDKDKDKE